MHDREFRRLPQTKKMAASLANNTNNKFAYFRVHSRLILFICDDQRKSAANTLLLIADRFFRAMLLKSLLQPGGNRIGIAHFNVMALHHVDQLAIAHQRD